MAAKFTFNDVAEMWEHGFLPVDLLLPIPLAEMCGVEGCKDLLVQQVGFPQFCLQHSLEWHARWGNPGADPDPFNGGPYIPIAERGE